MANYLIFTESTGDLTPALIEQTGLQVLPMSFTLDGNTVLNNIATFIENNENDNA